MDKLDGVAASVGIGSEDEVFALISVYSPYLSLPFCVGTEDGLRCVVEREGERGKGRGSCL